LYCRKPVMALSTCKPCGLWFAFEPWGPWFMKNHPS
jgi:hypothetical protein